MEEGHDETTLWSVRAVWPDPLFIRCDLLPVQLEVEDLSPYMEAAQLCDDGHIEEGLRAYEALLPHFRDGSSVLLHMVLWGRAVALDQLGHAEAAWEGLQALFCPGRQLITAMPLFLNWLQSSIIIGCNSERLEEVETFLTLFLNLATCHPGLGIQPRFLDILNGAFWGVARGGDNLEAALDWLERLRALWEPADSVLIPVRTLLVEGMSQLYRFDDALEEVHDVLDWAREEGFVEIEEQWKAQREHLESLVYDPYNLALLDNREGLVKLGKVNKIGPSGRTALMGAAKTGNLELASWLISRRANVNLISSDGWTALLLAADENQEEMIRLLARHKADLAGTNETDQTGLHLAAWQNHLEAAQTLIELGVDVHHCDSDGNTALHLAATEPVAEMIAMLVELVGVDVRNENTQGTPLMSAAAAGLVEVLVQLVDLGADPEAIDIDGEKALDYAVNNGHQDAADYLRQLVPRKPKRKKNQT